MVENKKYKRTVIYVRSKDRLTLQTLSDKTRLTQAEILSQWLSSIQTVLDRFESLPYDRLSMASYASNAHRQVLTMFQPIICGEPQFELDSKSESVNESRADLAVIKDLETKLSKNQNLSLREKNILIKARKIKVD